MRYAWLGPVWFALPFLLETFTLYSLPISRRTNVRNLPLLRRVARMAAGASYGTAKRSRLD
jgi:hypothetical protein